jgi:hypothetical protein
MPTTVVTITHVPTGNATVTPVTGNATMGPVIGNVTATPTAAPGNVTERIGNTNVPIAAGIIILALLLLGLYIWNQSRSKK